MILSYWFWGEALQYLNINSESMKKIMSTIEYERRKLLILASGKISGEAIN